MILHFQNARLVDPEALTDEPGSLTVQPSLSGSYYLSDRFALGARLRVHWAD